MELQTKILIDQQRDRQIDYRSNILLFGSCFAENISEKLSYFKFKNCVNPFGILFHPLAIESLITNSINNRNYSAEDLFFYNELWHSYETHSKLSSHSQKEVLKVLNTAINDTHDQLHKASHIVFTLGTSWVYRHIETDNIVASCHKVPQKKFQKELLTVDEVSESLQAIIRLIRSANPQTTIIFTVSPVRHLKDGFVENNQSKAHLLSAIHQNIEPRNQIHYFPAFEIMMDELRDYRFYAEDMIHPNQQAVDHIWYRFCQVWTSPETQLMMKEIESIQKGFDHKPFYAESEQHQKFLKNLEQRKENFLKQFPYIVFKIHN
jgi:hypothetical protein